MDKNVLDNEAFQGSEVKDLGNGKIGGYAVIFTREGDTDLAGDFFTKETNFHLQDREYPVYWAHALDKTLDDRVLGTGSIKQDELGIWIEAQLNLRDAYEVAIYNLARKGKLGWSTGVPSHLARREGKETSNFIKSWPISEISLTPTPCEPRTSALPLKSLEPITLGALVDKEEMLFPNCEPPMCSLKASFDICVLNVRALLTRLNSIKELRESQNRKLPLTKENLSQLIELDKEIKSLINATATAVELAEGAGTKAKEHQALINDAYNDAQDLSSWLATLD